MANQAIGTAVFGESFPPEYKPNVDFQYKDIANYEEMYQWMNGVLVGALDMGESDYTSQYEKVLGKVRLRQLRVVKDGCSLPSGLVKDGKGNSTLQKQAKAKLDKEYEMSFE